MQQQLLNEAVADLENDKQNFAKTGTSNLNSRTGVIINDAPVKGVSSRPASEVQKGTSS
jgi:hypothetical protein